MPEWSGGRDGAARRGAPPKGRGAVSMCGSAAGRDQPPLAPSKRTAYDFAYNL
ncbi:hypothetical protein GCM10012282_21810 [Streptomyces lacrimifluminis]|uniref:Uncharacterized protein n=1 Tax=Streptomyces lacrimifluminis TaxID=1500077 RepID=A0A917NSL4_9ACTN|nr:hypothetical protein GCM10012282_21810 [Streptomyces lacrimifluminis]